ncbi:GatB/YqeY domain-containing protein [Falsigemmobacter faecalis]|uniref:GatB/YqeY domain-containing protein n=1 Tax=Falsigemmobacter faecalis TaxID=2488730 RepID=A0A3P3D4W2_9RHOB|nr:GatB/YqeY domain-containing protein [Falsigemmobacter faecalis]RRH69415.1 GatB/YqeY domain-containing protein [Falsigemmobacter faecalis]
MSLRDSINDGLKQSMKARDAARTSTLRLISAAIRDRDIAARGEGASAEGIADGEILALLGKMVRQRQESAKIYEEGGRLELAAKELSEITIIEDFLPRQLTAAETEAAIAAVIAATGASGIRDMGKVMAALKETYTGSMDFSTVGAAVKARLM